MEGMELWCDANGVAPLHATPSEIVTFLTELAGRIAITTVGKYCITIAMTYDAAASDVINPARHIMVRNVMKGLHREKGQPPAQMTGLTDEDFARIQVTARRPKAWETEHQAHERGTLDLALIGVMRDGLLRAGEAAALRWVDLQEDDDGSGTLYIARSKIDQEGQGAMTYVSRQTMRYLRELRELRNPQTDQAIIFYPRSYDPAPPDPQTRAACRPRRPLWRPQPQNRSGDGPCPGKFFAGPDHECRQMAEPGDAGLLHPQVGSQAERSGQAVRSST